MRYATLVSIAAVLATGPTAAPPQAPAVRYDKVYPLQAGEGVFAYARISPDGRTLAYASMMRNQTVQTVVDLSASKVLFTEPGIDAYWSLDGRRMIFLAQSGAGGGVTIRHHASGELVRDVAPDGSRRLLQLGGPRRPESHPDDREQLLLSRRRQGRAAGRSRAAVPGHRHRRSPAHLEGRPADHDLRPRRRRHPRSDRLRQRHRYGPAAARRRISRSTDATSRSTSPKPGARGLRDRGRGPGEADVANVDRSGGLELLSELDRGWPAVLPLRRRRLPRVHDGRRTCCRLPEQPLPAGGARVPATLRWEELFPETPQPAADTTS